MIAAVAGSGRALYAETVDISMRTLSGTLRHVSASQICVPMLHVCTCLLVTLALKDLRPLPAAAVDGTASRGHPHRPTDMRADASKCVSKFALCSFL